MKSSRSGRDARTAARDAAEVYAAKKTPPRLIRNCRGTPASPVCVLCWVDIAEGRELGPYRLPATVRRRLFRCRAMGRCANAVASCMPLKPRETLPSQITRSAGDRGLPDPCPVLIEGQLRIFRCGEPAMLGEFVFELTWSPAGVAKSDEEFHRTFMMADVAQNFATRGHGNSSIDIESLSATIVCAVHDKADLGFDGAARKDADAAIDSRILLAHCSQETSEGALFDQAIDDNAEGTLLIVLHDEDNRMIKAWIAYIRRSDQQLSGE